MKHVRTALPFVAVFVLLIASVLIARVLHSRPSDVYPVNTMPTQDGEVFTVRVFKSISSVVVIDRANHAHKKHLAPTAYTYDGATTRLAFSEPIPFAEPVIHIEGVSVQPEQFCLADFSGTADELLVLLKDRVAILDYEYTYDAATHMVTFRSDLHPETDGLFHLAYQTADGAMHGFGNWSKKESDTLSALLWQWMHKTQGAPMLVMKDRTGVSDRTLRKEAGFSVRLPQGESTFLQETMESTQKRVSVLRWYDGGKLVVEAKTVPFLPADTIVSQTTVQIGKMTVTKQEIVGTQSTGNSEPKSAPLVLYGWQNDGVYYQMTVEPSQTDAAEAVIARIR